MARIPSRVASKISVIKALNAIAGGTYLASKAEIPEGGGSTPGVGDMEKADYDPSNHNTDIFAYADSAEADANTYTDSAISTFAGTLDGVATSGDYDDLTNLPDLSAATLSALVGPELPYLTGVQEFASSGTYTPTSGTTSILVFGVGAGGGGGGIGSTSPAANTWRSGGFGGAGELRVATFLVTEPTYTVTIGSGGAAGSGSTPSAGSTGGNTTINDGTSNIFVCIGGGGGASNAGDDTNGVATNGAQGSGGTGGIGLPSLLYAGNRVTDIGEPGAPFNYLFGSSQPSLTRITTAGGSLAIRTTLNTGGFSNGPGGAGNGGAHFNTSSVATGGAGRDGYILIIEFGYP